MTYKANSKKDVARLAQRIRDTPADNRWQLAAEIVYLGLMNFREAPIQDIIKHARYTKNIKALYAFFTVFDVMEKQIIDFFIEDTAKHAINGNDTEDEDSVGGWSQREIDLLVEARGW